MDTDTIVNKYVNIIKKFTTKEYTQGQWDKPMLDFGVNSYNAIEIMIALEDEFNIDFPDSLINPELFVSFKTLYEGLVKAMAMKNNI